MAKKEKIKVLIEGGKATAAPPLGPALGPLKVNIGQVVTDINKKTQDFKGMKVPVEVIVDVDSKEYVIEIGTPPTSQLIKNELNLQKGSSKPKTEFVGNLEIEQIKKIARMKFSKLVANSLKSAVLEIAGTCFSIGIKVDNKPATQFIKDVKLNKYDKDLSEEI